MFLEGLDALDQQIVSLLIENARLSYSDIGEKVGLSRVAVKSRIQALEQRGVIEEYTTIINPQKISGAVSCYVELEFSPGGFGEAVARLEACPTVTQIYRVTGSHKLHVHAVAATNQEMEDLLHHVIDTLPGLQLQRHPRPDLGHQGPAAVGHFRVSFTTHSMCWVWGNISTGWICSIL